jgi:hypothetical protein
MSAPTLIYFAFRGRAFASRVALFNSLGKDGWKDQRVSLPRFKKAPKLGLLSAVCCLLSAVCNLLSAVWSVLSLLRCLLSSDLVAVCFVAGCLLWCLLSGFAVYSIVSVSRFKDTIE